MFDMMKKLQDAQRKMKEIKERLDQVYVESASPNGISITANGNRKITKVSISDNARSLSNSALEEEIAHTINTVIEKADKVNESEMKSAASGMMPGLGNLMSK